MVVAVVAGTFLVAVLSVVSLILWLDKSMGNVIRLQLDVRIGRWFTIGTRVVRGGGADQRIDPHWAEPGSEIEQHVDSTTAHPEAMPGPPES